MALTTRIAPFYAGQKLFAVILCVGFALWGAYDYWVTIPKQEKLFGRYQQLKTDYDELEKIKTAHDRSGTSLTDAEIEKYNQTVAELEAVAPGGRPPTKPGKFNRATQWIYMACFPFAFLFLWLYLKAKRQVYTLDDDGTLHFAGDPVFGSGAWPQPDIADIDMNRWMAKSVAYAVHQDGTRLKLDAYLHKNLDLIIGALASRLHPDQWDSQAKPVKAAEPNPDEGVTLAEEPAPSVND